MSQLSHTPFAVLDLAPMRDDDAGPGPALRRSLDLARHVERLGFSRLWVAEHHNMEGIASSATAVVGMPGVLETVIPRSRAAARSIASTPVPKRDMHFNAASCACVPALYCSTPARITVASRASRNSSSVVILFPVW